jgi:hypothetical protein
VDYFTFFQVDHPLLPIGARKDEAAGLIGVGNQLDDIRQIN